MSSETFVGLLKPDICRRSRLLRKQGNRFPVFGRQPEHPHESVLFQYVIVKDDLFLHFPFDINAIFLYLANLK